MSGDITIVVGQRVGAWEVLSADDSGKRLTCRCRCGEVRVVALTALENGSCRSCGCSPLSPKQRAELRGERARRALDEWRTT
jgi:hypothetical protein